MANKLGDWYLEVDGYKVKCERITKPQVYDPPQELLVNVRGKLVKKVVKAILGGKDEFPVLCDDGKYSVCCEIPKPRRPTNLELAEWCAKGKGQIHIVAAANCHTFYSYQCGCDDDLVYNDVEIRPFGSKEFVKPDALIMELENPYNGKKVESNLPLT